MKVKSVSRKCSIQGSIHAQTGLLERLKSMPKGALIPVDSIVAELESHSSEERPNGLAQVDPPISPETPPTKSWRTLLWDCPAEVRIGVSELCEAMGRPKSWCYKHTCASSANRIPHRLLDGALVFLVGEIREFIRENEIIVQGGPTDGTPLLRVAR